MANQFASISSAISILKNWYEGPIVSQFNDLIPLWRDMQKGTEKFSGLQVVRPIKVRRNPGIGAVSENGLLPAIGQQTTQQALIAAKYNYLRYGVTAQMIKASQNDRGAFISAQAFEMEQGVLDLKSDFNRQLFWNGNGTLATVSANAVGTVITVTGRESTEDGSKYLDIGIVIDIVRAGVVVASSVAITSLSGTTTATLGLSAAVNVQANDLVIRSGSLNNEVQGLLYTMDGGSSVIYGIDRSLFPIFGSNAVSNQGNQLSLDSMQQAYNQGMLRGGADYDAVYCDYGTERMYNKLLVADKRFAAKVVGDGTFSKKGGSYLEFAGRPVVPDKDCPQRFFMLDSSNWKKYVLGSELEWADETGSPMIAQVSTDSFESRLRLFANIFCEKPSAQAVLTNYVSP